MKLTALRPISETYALNANAELQAGKMRKGNRVSYAVGDANVSRLLGDRSCFIQLAAILAASGRQTSGSGSRRIRP